MGLSYGTLESRLAEQARRGHVTFGWGEISVADLQRLLALPDMARIRALSIQAREDLGDTAIDLLIGSPWLGQLATLELCGWGITDEGLARLAAAPAFAGVRRLSLDTSGMRQGRDPLGARPFAGMWVNRVGDAGYAALAASPHTAGLRELDLGHTVPGRAGVTALCAAPLVAQLERLRLVSSPAFAVEGAHALAARPDLTLRALTVEHAGLGDEGAAALAAARSLDRLEALGLMVNAIGDAGARALAASSALRALTDLDLRRNTLGPAGAAALAGRTGLPALIALGLTENTLFSTEHEEWHDWDGTVVGGGPRPLSPREIQAEYFFPQALRVY